MTFHVTIMFGLSFMIFLRPFWILLGYFNYNKFVGILFLGFWAAILNWHFRFQTSNFRDVN